MKRLDRGARQHLRYAARVAGLSTLIIIAMYAVLCTAFDVVDHGHLLAQVDDRLTDRLTDVAHNHFAGHPPSEADDDHEIAAPPVVLWRVGSSGHVVPLSDNAPALSKGTWAVTGQPTSVTIGRAIFRVQAARIQGRWIVAGESLSEVGHIQSIVLAE